MITNVLLLLVLGYLACGLLFAIVFALFGAQKIDPLAGHGSWGFRLLIIPGAAGLWPFLLARWCKGIHSPPEESNAHRRAAKGSL